MKMMKLCGAIAILLVAMNVAAQTREEINPVRRSLVDHTRTDKLLGTVGRPESYDCPSGQIRVGSACQLSTSLAGGTARDFLIRNVGRRWQTGHNILSIEYRTFCSAAHPITRQCTAYSSDYVAVLREGSFFAETIWSPLSQQIFPDRISINAGGCGHYYGAFITQDMINGGIPASLYSSFGGTPPECQPDSGNN